MRTSLPLIVLILASMLIACASDDSLEHQSVRETAPQSDACGAHRAGLTSPADAPASVEVINLGRRLFSDPQLSGDRSVSCATCHVPTRAFADGRRRSVGAHGTVTRRSTPTLYNVAYQSKWLWDGRASTLEEQVMIALQNPEEMGMTHDLVGQHLRSYNSEFLSLFGQAPSMETVAKAIAAYEKTLSAANSPVDRYLYCAETNALSALEKEGLELFSGPANCIRCHWFFHETVHPFGGRMALFTDGRFHNIGAGEFEDAGRGAITGRAEDWGAFKTPTLRNISLTAPYMHDGSLATLREVVEFYNRGSVMNSADPSIRPLRLTSSEIDALVAFLNALTSMEVEYATSN